MRAAYVDTSCLVAVAFGERGAGTVERELARHERLYASNLLEAEFRAALAREGVASDDSLLDGIGWVLPDRPLGPEIGAALAAGRLRGADLWHLATALFLAGNAAGLAFLTLDARQRETARRLGLSAP